MHIFYSANFVSKKGPLEDEDLTFLTLKCYGSFQCCPVADCNVGACACLVTASHFGLHCNFHLPADLGTSLVSQHWSKRDWPARYICILGPTFSSSFLSSSSLPFGSDVRFPPSHRIRAFANSLAASVVSVLFRSILLSSSPAFTLGAPNSH